VVHKHYLAYFFVQLSLFYILTSILGHFFRQWRKTKNLAIVDNADAKASLIETEDASHENFKATKSMTDFLNDSSFYNYTFISLITPVKEPLGLTKLQNDYFYKCSMVFFIQFSMSIVLIKYELFDDDAGTVEIPTIQNMFLRLFTAYLFHMMSYTDIDGAFRRLKFLRHNAHKFDSETIWCAFMSTQYQFIVTIICESTSLLYITRQKRLIDIVLNYLSFRGIVILDDLFAASQRKFKIRDDIGNAENSEIFKEALQFDKEHSKTENKNTIMNPTHNGSALDYIVNAYIIISYNIERVFYKAFYFYALPYLVVFLSYYLTLA